MIMTPHPSRLALKSAFPLWKPLALALLVVAPGLALGQVRLGCEITPSLAMQFEPVYAVVTIQNNTGEPLDFSEKGNAGLEFRITNDKTDEFLVKRPAQLHYNLVIPPGNMAKVTNELVSTYGLIQLGGFTVRARVGWKDLYFTADDDHLSIQPGMVVESLRGGVPGTDEVRLYSLRVLTRDRYDHLFFRLDDEKQGACLGVYDLGRCVRVRQPSLKVDREAKVHVLYQSSPSGYGYQVFNPDGVRVDGDELTGAYDRVELAADADGKVTLNAVESPEVEITTPPKSGIEDRKVRRPAD